MNENNIKHAIELISSNQIGVMPTDTIFGVVGTALSPETVNRIYQAKGRDSSKPFIILISNTAQLNDFDLHLSRQQYEVLETVWPGPNSVIMDCPSNKYKYLHRGVRSLAFRLPEAKWLREIINTTGPIIATSANSSGNPHANTIDQAKKDLPGLDFYFDGAVNTEPSKLFVLENNSNLRQIERH